MRETGPVFTEADLGGTVDCDVTGWIPISLGAADGTEQWGVTLIAGLRHDPAVALWGVATWEHMQQPVCCFTAPTASTAPQLCAAAAHAFTGPGRNLPGLGQSAAAAHTDGLATLTR